MPESFETHSQQDHFAAALQRLAEGRIALDRDAYRLCDPAACQNVYQDLRHNRTAVPSSMFDWR